MKYNSMMKALAAALLLAVTVPVAQAAERAARTPATPAQQAERQLQMIQALDKRIAALEEKVKAGTATDQEKKALEQAKDRKKLAALQKKKADKTITESEQKELADLQAKMRSAGRGNRPAAGTPPPPKK